MLLLGQCSLPSPGLSCQMLLVHLPDSRPSPHEDEVVWPFYQDRDSSSRTRPLFWQPVQLPSYGFLFFDLKVGPSAPWLRTFSTFWDKRGLRGAFRITLWVAGGVKGPPPTPVVPEARSSSERLA